jgi:hypothetical protein
MHPGARCTRMARRSDARGGSVHPSAGMRADLTASRLRPERASPGARVGAPGDGSLRRRARAPARCRYGCFSQKLYEPLPLYE